MLLKFTPRFHRSPDVDGQGGGGGGAQDKSAENQLIERLKTTIADQVRSAFGSDDSQKTIESVLTKMYSGMSPDQIRTALGDSEKVKKDVLDLAGQLTKLQERTASVMPSVVASDKVIAKVIETRFAAVETLLKKQDPNSFVALNLRAAAIMTTDNTVDINGVTAEELEQGFSIDSFVGKRRDREFIFDIADRTGVANIEKFKRWYEEGDDEGAFAIVEEGAYKPLVSMNLVLNTSEAQKVAGQSIYTDEVPKFRREAYNIIRRLIRDKLLRDYHDILTTGLTSEAAPYVGSALDGQYPNPTDYHAIGAVAAQIESLNFVPDVLILNPQDKWRIGLSQDLTGAFYMAIPAGSPQGTNRLLGFYVVTSNKVPVGQFILGESNLWKIEDESITVKIGYGTTQIKNAQGVVTDVQDDISHNRFRVISEMFFHSYIASNHQGSFVMANFAAVKELLQAEGSPEVEA